MAHNEHFPDMTRAAATVWELEEIHDLLSEVVVYLDSIEDLLEQLVASQT